MAVNEKQSKDPVESKDCCDGLDDEEFKKLLMSEVAKLLHERKPLQTLWPKLNKQTNYNSQEVWKDMCRSVVKKFKCLLAKNDVVKEVDTAMRLLPTDWLLSDLFLVTEKVNVVDCEIMPGCLTELYWLIKKYNVESLVGDQLAEAWIDVTLNYNNSGRQCSPMLLQLRWYQLKKLAREQVFRPNESLHPNKAKLFHSIAIAFQKIITMPFPKWKILLRQKRVILPEHFVKVCEKSCFTGITAIKIIKEKWKDIEACDTWYLKCNTVNFRKERTVSEDTSKKPKSLSTMNNTILTLDSDEEIENFLKEKAESFSAKLKENKGAGEGKVLKRNKQIDTELESGDENKRKHNEKSVTESPSTESRENNNAGIDLKLAMNTIVYTKKIDAMQVFKNFDYSFVNDRKVIEDVILESKPEYERAHKGDDVVTDKHKSLTHSNINENQNKNPELVALNGNSRVLKKPQNLKFNPIKLRKNPDFHVRLKALTTKFLSSPRNRKLLKQCKPLTIDLYRVFGNKLVNGTMCVKGVEFHKPNIVNIEIYDHLLFFSSLRPPAVEQIDTVHLTEPMNIDKNINTIWSPNIEQAVIGTASERRKIIKLPYINNVRILNQSLQTAEVPMLNDNTNNTPILKQLLSMEPKGPQGI